MRFIGTLFVLFQNSAHLTLNVPKLRVSDMVSWYLGGENSKLN